MKWAFVTKPGSETLVRSYLFLRSGIGIIGVALPVVLVIGAIILDQRFEFLDSMSSYYYSVMRDVFVGSLWAIAIFLICYRYDYLDDFASTIAGICAIGVALFPTTPDVDATQGQTAIGVVHAVFASCFFLVLALMSIILFQRGNPEKDKVTDTDRKRKRRNNLIYRICGITMVACILLAALILFVPYLSDNRWQHQYHPIFFIEFIATWAFGWAWFVKGQTYSKLKATIQRRPFIPR